jgi:polyisoprenoid-binding protein YceI
MIITKWTIDKAHSEVQFKAKHLVISTVTGYFKDFDGWLETSEGNLELGKAWFRADVNTISTNNNDRDNHLKSVDFFDAVNHPFIQFESTNIKRREGQHYTMTGNLTIRGVTKEISLNVEYGGMMKDPYGNTKAGFEITGKVNRHEFGLKWNAVTEAGGVVVGEDIRLALNIQMTKS